MSILIRTSWYAEAVRETEGKSGGKDTAVRARWAWQVMDTTAFSTWLLMHIPSGLHAFATRGLVTTRLEDGRTIATLDQSPDGIQAVLAERPYLVIKDSKLVIPPGLVRYTVIYERVDARQVAPIRRVVYGWHRSARSVGSQTGSGGVRFQIPRDAGGVVVGYSHNHVAVAGTYAHIPRGLLFSHGKIFDAATGEERGAYQDRDEFIMGFLGDRYVVTQNGATVVHDVAHLSMRTPRYFCAVLLRPNDRVVDAAWMPLAGGQVTARMRSSLSAGAMPQRAGATVEQHARVEAAASFNSLVVHARQRHIYTRAGVEAGISGARMHCRVRVHARPAFDLGADVTAAMGGYARVVLGEPRVAKTRAVMRSLARAGRQRVAAMPRMRMYAQVQTAPHGTVALLSSLGARSEVASVLVYLQIIHKGLTLGEVVTTLKSVLEVIHEQLALTTDVQARATLQQTIHELLTLRGLKPEADTGYETWVVNPDTGASTTYSGFDFNSYCERGGEYFAANDQGIHRLSGDTDNGRKIRAAIQLGDIDFAQSTFKGISECYIRGEDQRTAGAAGGGAGQGVSL